LEGSREERRGWRASGVPVFDVEVVVVEVGRAFEPPCNFDVVSS